MLNRKSLNTLQRSRTIKRLRKKKKIDDTFDIQHIFMKDFLQHLNVEEEKKKNQIKFKSKKCVIQDKKKVKNQTSLKSIYAIDGELYFKKDKTRNENYLYTHIIYT